MLRRIMKFNKDDWKHCWWLFRQMIKNFLLVNFKDSIEAYYWLKIHLSYDSTKMN